MDGWVAIAGREWAATKRERVENKLFPVAGTAPLKPKAGLSGPPVPSTNEGWGTRLFRPVGARSFATGTHGLRRGLHSFAASRREPEILSRRKRGVPRFFAPLWPFSLWGIVRGPEGWILCCIPVQSFGNYFVAAGASTSYSTWPL
jgi:hypothetical protein